MIVMKMGAETAPLAFVRVLRALQNEISMTSDAFTAEQKDFGAMQYSLCEWDNPA